MAAPITSDGFVQEVREFIRDFPELNRLTQGYEHSPRMIKMCMDLAIDEWNTTPPLDSRSAESFPSRVVLLYLTIFHLLFSVNLLRARNALPYSDGGFSVSLENTEQLYKQTMGMLRGYVDPKIRDLKTAINIAGGWGSSLGSDYGWQNGWYGYSVRN